jgi:hypothetical protein
MFQVPLLKKSSGHSAELLERFHAKADDLAAVVTRLLNPDVELSKELVDAYFMPVLFYMLGLRHAKDIEEKDYPYILYIFLFLICYLELASSEGFNFIIVYSHVHSICS